MNGITLNTVSQHPYLGITLDHKLSWHPHIKTLCHKVNHTIIGTNFLDIFISRQLTVSSSGTLTIIM